MSGIKEDDCSLNRTVNMHRRVQDKSCSELEVLAARVHPEP